MIPTLLTTLALVASSLSFAGQILFSQITQSTLFVNGSALISGNMFWLPDSSTTTTNTEYVGLTPIVQHLTSGYNFLTNGTQSGVSLQIDGLSRSTLGRGFPCTSTGGTNGLGGYYSTCVVPAPYSSTGAVTAISLECGGTKVSIAALSGGFLKTASVANRTAGSAVFTLQPPIFNINKTVGTGAMQRYGSGQILWNPKDSFLLQTSTVIPKTTGVDCKVFMNSFDKYGS